ncbi:MAG: VWA domain-containing protein [Acidimicrobiia bacterium]
MPNELTRRGFLSLLAAAGVGVLAGCTSDPDSATTTTLPVVTTGGGDGDLWSVWDQVRTALRGSPDHLAARAEALVAEGDAAAIHQFVRDSIATLPPRADGFHQAVTAIRWGMQGTLRGGAGTPREKAELLASMLQRAGYDAKVVMASFEPAALLETLGPREAARFDPAVDEAQLDRWLETIGATPADIAAFDPDGASSTQLGEGLLGNLEGTVGADPAFVVATDQVPLVSAQVNGQELVFDPLTPGAEPVAASATATLPAPPASPLPTVEVELAVTSTVQPFGKITVAQGSWPVDRLVGRRLVARFMPAGSLEDSLQVPPLQITTFVPVLAIDGPDVSAEDAASDAVIGDPVTVTGSVLTTDPAGTLLIDGTPVGIATTGTPDPGMLDLAINPSAFPHVRLQLRVADAAGTPILGASGASLTVMEDDVPVPFLVREATPPPPRVLVLFDGSLSIPEEFRGSAAVGFARELATDLFQAFPDAMVRVAGVNFGLASASPSWMADVDSVAAEVVRLITDGSEYWSAIADAAALGANVIVLVTDGQSTDPEDRAAEAQLKAAVGPPVVAIGVGEVDVAGLEEIAAVTSGSAHQAGSVADVVESVSGYLTGREEAPLHVEYQALPDGPSPRTVTVAMGSMEASGEYEVPDPHEAAPPPSLTGLHLIVRSGGAETVRTLAGKPLIGAGVQEPPSQDVLQEVRAGLFGVALLSVEGPAPTLSAWLDDVFTARLSLRPLVEAGSSLGDFVAALEEGVHHCPSELLALHAPLVADGPPTFEVAPRMVLLTRRPTYAGGAVRRTDILPFTKFATASTDPAEAFRLTAQRTARLALVESDIFTDSTASRLDGRPLELLAPAVPGSREGAYALQAALLDRWAADYRLIPGDEGEFAFWAIDKRGSVLGILPDGSGGGASFDGNAQCKAMNQTFSALDLLGGLFGLPFAFGAFLALGKAIAKQAYREAAIIASLGGDMPDTSQCGDPVKDVPCDLAKDLISGLAHPLEAASKVEKVYGVAQGGDLLDC